MFGHTQHHASRATTQSNRSAHLASAPAFTNPESVHGINQDLNQTAPTKYEMRHIPGKGMGLIATAHIPRGEQIMANTASLMIDYRAFNELTRAQYTALQAHAVAHLPADHAAAILALSPDAATTTTSNSTTQADLIDAIAATNGFDIDPSPTDADQHHSFFVLFPSIARMNHDCRPSAEYRYSARHLAQYVVAARDIRPGEELTLSYINPLMVRARRVGRLRKNWGFDCGVERIGEVRRELEVWPEEGEVRGRSGEASPEMGELLVALYEMEQLWGSMHEAYAMAALEFSGVGDAWTAVKYASLGLEWGIPMLGEEDEEVEELRSLAEDPWGHWSWRRSTMAAEPPKPDPAKAIEAIREARPPATDRFTYLTIVETNLCPEVLPTLNEVLQDPGLTQEIGWDLVFNLASLPGSEECLETVARLGNPREVILKVLETLELLDGENGEDEEDGGEQGKPEPAVSPTNKFITLLGMLAILHKRIRTKYPSRFLAQTLQTVYRAYRPNQEMTASVLNLVHSLSGQRRPPLPSRKSSVNVANPDQTGDASKNAPDPEADRDDREDPDETDLQQKLLLSFATCILEAYANGNEMAWAARLLEFYNPEKIVPGRRTLMAAFREEQELLSRDSIVGKLVALIGDLGLDSCSKAFIHQVCDGPMHSNPLEEPDLSSPDKITLSTGGCVCLVAYWAFSSTVFDASHPQPEMHVFPEHFAVLDKFLQDDAHSQIQNSVGTIEALITIGLWLESNNLVSTNPSSPLTNPAASPEDPTSDFMRYIHLTTLIALYHPSIQVRNAASVLAGLVLHANPEDDDRLKILEDLLENCMFATLKARAVAWLREELLAAAAAAPPSSSAQKQPSQQQPNLFATPQALETVQYVVFPPLASLLDLPTLGLVEYLTANAPFLMQAVNFALFLWGSASSPSSESSSSSSSESDDDDDEEEEGAKRRRRMTKQQKEKRPQKKDDDDSRFRRFHFSNEHYHTRGKVSKRDGRLAISLSDMSDTGYLAKALGTAARKMAPLAKLAEEGAEKAKPQAKPPTHPPPPPPPPPPHPQTSNPHRGSTSTGTGCGSRRTRRSGPLCRTTAPAWKTVRAGDVGRRRASMARMFRGFWRACINATDEDETDPRNVRMMGERDPFVADAIIANPPSFAHIHCAEALGIPVHLMFTFPYTPTQAFPHPLASIKRSNVDPGYTNWISYPLVEMMVWQGLGDLVNEFRVRTLGLDPVSTLWAPGTAYRLHVPFTYLWSPGLIPKPPDWGDEVDVAGFVFLDLASSFDPPKELVKFLEEGDEPPVYIGFGSIVVDDADRFTNMIFDAVKKARVRALVSKGWGGLGGDSLDVPDGVFMLDNTPHDWLFPRVRACVIHGGAGTTAIALKCGKPTMIVPFFGDQHFWGSMVANAGAGPDPVPYKHLTAEKLAEGIKYCITDDARKAVEKIAKDIEEEGDGAENACRAFHRGLILQGTRSMRCSILPDRVAVWQMKKTRLRLSAVAAEMLVERGLLSWKKLHLLRHNEWNDFEGPGEPLTGAAGSLMSSVGNVFSGVGKVPYLIGKGAKKRKEKKKQKKEERSKKDSGSADGKQSSGDSRPDDSQQGDANEDVPHIETTTTHAMNRQRTTSTTSTSPVEEAARQVGRGAVKSASALARTPVDLIQSLAQGFHNAPRLYGDDTVRRPTRVTGMKSGLRAARREFAYGIYDGWTGVVRLPVRGARDDGIRGFIPGVGMGLTGFVLKNIAAIIGPVGYTLQGVVKQAERRRQPIKYIRRARVVQGKREGALLSEDDRREKVNEVVAGWRLMRQLWEEMNRAERKGQKGLRGRLSRNARRLRKSREWDVVFENGDGLDSLLGKGSAAVDESNAIPPGEANGDDNGSSTLADKDPLSSPHDSGHGIPADSVLDKAAPDDNAREDENPFSGTIPAIAENKVENRQTMAALGIQAST
ncbi:hypothetical protein B0I37DRAFT_390386 [Chaetomium sp. MPI-CAGE-AT-0009]|nr:hypothetical protein B0I37DRAFT_390386 [Chaetomium sp. MPI-CAGE-AT-0009]